MMQEEVPHLVSSVFTKHQCCTVATDNRSLYDAYESSSNIVPINHSSCITMINGSNSRCDSDDSKGCSDGNIIAAVGGSVSNVESSTDNIAHTFNCDYDENTDERELCNFSIKGTFINLNRVEEPILFKSYSMPVSPSDDSSWKHLYSLLFKNTPISVYDDVNDEEDGNINQILQDSISSVLDNTENLDDNNYIIDDNSIPSYLPFSNNNVPSYMHTFAMENKNKDSCASSVCQKTPFSESTADDDSTCLNNTESPWICSLGDSYCTDEMNMKQSRGDALSYLNTESREVHYKEAQTVMVSNIRQTFHESVHKSGYGTFSPTSLLPSIRQLESQPDGSSKYSLDNSHTMLPNTFQNNILDTTTTSTLSPHNNSSCHNENLLKSFNAADISQPISYNTDGLTFDFVAGTSSSPFPVDELTLEELSKIPRDENGKLLSVGSIGHQDGSCKPCVFFSKRSKECAKGLKCLFCHYPHAPKKRVRTSQKKNAQPKNTTTSCSEDTFMLPGTITVHHSAANYNSNSHDMIFYSDEVDVSSNIRANAMPNRKNDKTNVPKCNNGATCHPLLVYTPLAGSSDTESLNTRNLLKLCTTAAPNNEANISLSRISVENCAMVEGERSFVDSFTVTPLSHNNDLSKPFHFPGSSDMLFAENSLERVHSQFSFASSAGNALNNVVDSTLQQAGALNTLVTAQNSHISETQARPLLNVIPLPMCAIPSNYPKTNTDAPHIPIPVASSPFDQSPSPRTNNYPSIGEYNTPVDIGFHDNEHMNSITGRQSPGYAIAPVMSYEIHFQSWSHSRCRLRLHGARLTGKHVAKPFVPRLHARAFN